MSHFIVWWKEIKLYSSRTKFNVIFSVVFFYNYFHLLFIAKTTLILTALIKMTFSYCSCWHCEISCILPEIDVSNKLTFITTDPEQHVRCEMFLINPQMMRTQPHQPQPLNTSVIDTELVLSQWSASIQLSCADPHQLHQLHLCVHPQLRVVSCCSWYKRLDCSTVWIWCCSLMMLCLFVLGFWGLVAVFFIFIGFFFIGKVRIYVWYLEK